jgi:hypothetical protein
MPDDRTFPDLTPEEEESVRRLLAAEGATREVVPAHVVGRLERSLAELAGERSGPAASATSADATARGARRRRTRLAGLLAAAAAVSVVGLGLGNLLGDQGGSGGAMSTAGVQEDSGGRAATNSQALPGGGAPLEARLPVVHRATFARDARRLVARQPATGRRAEKSVAADRDCPLPDRGRGDRVFAVLLDGRPATLVVRAGPGTTRLAQVYSCDHPAEPLASARLPLR